MSLAVFGVHINRTNPRTPPTAMAVRKSTFLVLPAIVMAHRSSAHLQKRELFVDQKSICQASRCTRCPGSSLPEIIAHYQAENEPGGADRAFQRTADLRFSDTRVVAHRNFNHAESGQGAFEDHLNRPAIGGLFEGECAQHICAGSAKRTEIGDFYSIEKPDQAGGETIPKHLMPRQRSSRTPLLEAGTERDVRTPLNDWR